jgi:hypothetical protein
MAALEATPVYSTSCDRANYEVRLFAGYNVLWEWRVGRIVRQILLAGKEANERPALLRHVIAYRAAQHRVSFFKSG